MYSIPSSKPHWFGIGIVHRRDDLVEGLFDITVGTSLTSEQLRQMRHLFDLYVNAVLPGRVDVATLLDKIHSILGEGATIQRSPNVAYYGDNHFGRGWTYIDPIYTIFHNGEYIHYIDKGSIIELENFLKTVNACT